MERCRNLVDADIRSAGVVLVDVSNLTAIASNKWIGRTTVDGVDRFFQIEVVAKSIDFDEDSLNAILTERELVETRKAATKAKANAKKDRDIATRAKVKELTDAKKAETAK
jgi:hypothetical protein